MKKEKHKIHPRPKGKRPSHCQNDSKGNLEIFPIVKRYFYIPEQDILLNNGISIPATHFLNDDGKKESEFKIFEPNGYTNLYINGVLQEGNFYRVYKHSLWIIPVESTIFHETPIIIESIGFSIKSN